MNPLAWTTYGLVTSQLGNVQTLVSQPDGSQISIVDYLSTNYAFQHYYVGWCVLILVGFSLFFRFVSAIGLQTLHYQSR